MKLHEAEWGQYGRITGWVWDAMGDEAQDEEAAPQRLFRGIHILF